MAVEYTKEDYKNTLTFLRDVLFDYKYNKALAHEVLTILLADSRLRLRAQAHVEVFYPEGIVKGIKP